MFSRRDWWIGGALVAAIVAVYLLSLTLAPAGSDFGGTDATATGMIDATAWAEPIFQPSGELESGLFAIQAALGGLLLGFVLGRLSGRRR